LNQQDDPLSIDCGGDCWGCVGEMEADMGCVESLAQVRIEFELGLRPAWVDLSIGTTMKNKASK
jgi:hypothetical protein